MPTLSSFFSNLRSSTRKLSHSARTRKKILSTSTEKRRRIAFSSPFQVRYIILYVLGVTVYYFGWSWSTSLLLVDKNINDGSHIYSAFKRPGSAEAGACHLDPPWGTTITTASTATRTPPSIIGDRKTPYTVCVGASNVSTPDTTASQLTCNDDTHNSIPPQQQQKLGSSSPFSDNSRSNPPSLTIVLLYYASPSMLLFQLHHYQTMMMRMLLQEDNRTSGTSTTSRRPTTIRLLIVDDGSPPGLRASDYITTEEMRRIAATLQNTLQVQIAQIIPNIPWNQPGARNLAMYIVQQQQQQQQLEQDEQQQHHLVVLLDLDLLLPWTVLQDVLTKWPATTKIKTKTETSTSKATPSSTSNTNSTTTSIATIISRTSSTDRSGGDKDIVHHVVHTFNRSRPDGITYKIHPSAMALTPSTWWSQVGGMDEDFSGHYGSEDSAFWWKWEQGDQQHQQPQPQMNQHGNPNSWSNASSTTNATRIRRENWFHGESILEQFDIDDPCDEKWLSTVSISKTVPTCSQCLLAHQKLPTFSRSTNFNLVQLKKKKQQGCWSNSFLRFHWRLFDIVG